MRFEKGELVSAKKINELANQFIPRENPGFSSEKGLAFSKEPKIFVVLTSGTGSQYNWKQIQWDGANWVDCAATGIAEEINGMTGLTNKRTRIFHDGIGWKFVFSKHNSENPKKYGGVCCNPPISLPSVLSLTCKYGTWNLTYDVRGSYPGWYGVCQNTRTYCTFSFLEQEVIEYYQQITWYFPDPDFLSVCAPYFQYQISGTIQQPLCPCGAGVNGGICFSGVGFDTLDWYQGGGIVSLNCQGKVFTYEFANDFNLVGIGCPEDPHVWDLFSEGDTVVVSG